MFKKSIPQKKSKHSFLHKAFVLTSLFSICFEIKYLKKHVTCLIKAYNW